MKNLANQKTKIKPASIAYKKKKLVRKKYNKNTCMTSILKITKHCKNKLTVI